MTDHSISDGVSIDVDPEIENDSAYGGDDWVSLRETTSIKSSIYRGLMENGRRYQSLRNKEYCLPSDEQQFEAYEAGHLVDLILDSERENPLFRAPCGDDKEAPLHILDIGTGMGTWVIDVADMFPNSIVRGVDLYPPPISWMPPNCTIEVDDVLQEWTWREPFDFIRMRNMIGSFDQAEWDRVYQQCYDKLKPGGWIEQYEVGPFVECDDGSLPEDSVLAKWGPNVRGCGERAGRTCDVIFTMASSIREKGFIEMHEKNYKWPIGPWAKHQKFKEAGLLNYEHWMSGIEGWCMWLLTKFGAPKPWKKEEVYVYCARMRNDIKNPAYHTYHRAKRIWARKPFPGEVSQNMKATTESPQSRPVTSNE
ncbi:hypothetical protein N7481_006429 [Penicillium waksmanii]|uniref:uncharacterized protein n=1 Tax=Penicillium waksmanii TaxID=69791 RepID=UPI002546CABF|nr:uncharacterized protein N7481_006429 [Penicillium waksmanii]KAJ5984330.1 hypothetical protein N7481_006429 [Penicillium waksmanii]